MRKKVQLGGEIRTSWQSEKNFVTLVKSFKL